MFGICVGSPAFSVCVSCACWPVCRQIWRPEGDDRGHLQSLFLLSEVGSNSELTT